MTSDAPRDAIIALKSELAAAIERAEQLRACSARIVQAEVADRYRLSQALHDGAQQRFGSVALQLEVVHRQCLANEAGAAELLARTQSTLGEGLQELREFASLIAPVGLQERGLAALRELVIRAPMLVELELEDVGRYSAALESVLYAVTSATVARVGRHDAISVVRVSIRQHERELELTISGDGVHTVQAAGTSDLDTALARVEVLGGSFTAVSDEQNRTTICVRVPADNAA